MKPNYLEDDFSEFEQIRKPRRERDYQAKVEKPKPRKKEHRRNNQKIDECE